MKFSRVAVVFAILIVVCVSWAPTGTADDAGLITKQSKLSVAQTLDRLAAALRSKGATIFARVDHAAGAKKAEMDLRPTELLIFGNPKLGTPLMTANRKIALDLPMKALAWEDDAGVVWLAYTRPEVLKSRWGIEGRDPVFKKMGAVLDKLTNAAINP